MVVGRFVGLTANCSAAAAPPYLHASCISHSAPRSFARSRHGTRKQTLPMGAEGSFFMPDETHP
eukprot:6490847-Amphidinium_carterae.2